MKNATWAVIVALAVSVLYGQVAVGGQASSGENAIVTSVPRTMTYQGILKDAEGNPVEDGVYDVTFRIFNVESGGSSLWDQTLPCATTSGYFNAILSDVSLPFDEDYWLEVEVGGETLDPRQKMSMVGYAAKADTADYAFATAGGGNGWVDDGTVVRLETSSDSVGIGTYHPAEKLDVNGNLRVYNNAIIGAPNSASGNRIFVAGYNNSVSAEKASICGGEDNTISSSSATWASIGGGANNVIDNLGIWARIGGGRDNYASMNYAAIGGGVNNRARGYAATVCGGGGYYEADSNSAIGAQSVIGGGARNICDGDLSATLGGWHNRASGEISSVSGGENNTASGSHSVIGGGEDNTTSQQYATVGGGDYNTAADTAATVAGGDYNTASGKRSTVGGGFYNTASGECAVIPGGCSLLASGDYSVAMGSGARAVHNGSFVWADASNDEFSSTNDNQIMMLASGGTWIYADPDLRAGVTIHPGASAWSTYSDVNLKENLIPVNEKDILQKISSLPISEWNLKAQSDNIRHIGPTAQDFYDTFGLGESEKTISTVDADGVALAGVQALLERIEELEKEVAELKANQK